MSTDTTPRIATPDPLAYVRPDRPSSMVLMCTALADIAGEDLKEWGVPNGSILDLDLAQHRAAMYEWLNDQIGSDLERIAAGDIALTAERAWEMAERQAAVEVLDRYISYQHCYHVLGLPVPLTFHGWITQGEPSPYRMKLTSELQAEDYLWDIEAKVPIGAVVDATPHDGASRAIWLVRVSERGKPGGSWFYAGVNATHWIVAR